MHKQINLVGNRGAPSMGTPRVPSGCQQIDLFMHFLGARVLMASVEMNKISSSEMCPFPYGEVATQAQVMHICRLQEN